MKYWAFLKWQYHYRGVGGIGNFGVMLGDIHDKGCYRATTIGRSLTIFLLRTMQECMACLYDHIYACDGLQSCRSTLAHFAGLAPVVCVVLLHQ